MQTLRENNHYDTQTKRVAVPNTKCKYLIS